MLASDTPVAAPRVVILGAGLTGLSASMHLRRVGVPHRVLERSAGVGGLAATTSEAGYRFDRTGHLLHLRDASMRALVLELLGPGALVEIERESVVYSHGTVTPYPFQANVAGLPPDVAYACVRDFVCAHFDPAPPEVRTFEDFCVRHFGEAISRAFMIPYNEKLWGVHPREITAEWCDRFVPRPSLDDVLRGAFGVAPPRLGYNATFLYPRLGMGALPEAMAERAAPVELCVEPQAIDWRRRALRASGEEIPYEALISTIPLPELIDRLIDPPAEVREARGALRATSLQYLDVALNTPCERPWHWVYVPDPRLSFYRVGCYTTFSAALAPTGKGSLYVELAQREPVELGDILPRVADELVELGLIRAREAIRFARLRNISPAYVIYDAARRPALDVILPFLEQEGIASVGRYGAWEYASMEDALLAGRAAAQRAAAEAER